MAYSYFEVIASGGNTFNIPFDYIDQGEVSVYVDGAEASFTFTSSNVIDITPAPANGALVRIERATNLSERAVDFASGAVLTEEDLDKSNIQVYHAAQEALDKVEQTMQVDVDGKWDGQDRVIKSVADPVADTDAVNRRFITTNLPAINRVHQSINNVDTVANDLNEAVSEIDTVAGSITNVNTVGNAITNVDTTATHIANVNRVAQSADNVDTVEASIGNVDITAGDIDNVNNVGDNIADVVTVAANMTDVNTVANDIDKVITAANDLNEAVSEINTVAGNITAVDTVGTNITDVNTVANISTDVTKLVDRYFVQSTQPTSGMVQGDLWYSTTQNQLYTYTGTKWELTSAYSEAMVRENNYVAIANQTAFVGTDKNGYLMTLVDGATEFVYQNGILIEPTVDYTMDYATATVNLVVGASVDDEIRVVQINPFDSLEYNELVTFRDEADAAQAAAESARDLAQGYRDTALGARDAAQVSQAAALASENSAASSATAAANSEAASATSEANAATSEANALASANVAANPWVVDSGTQDISYSLGNVGIPNKELRVSANSASKEVIKIGSDVNYWNGINFRADRADIDQYIGNISANWGANEVTRLTFETGSDATNKDDGRIKFHTSQAGGAIQERVEIAPDGTVVIPNGIRNKGVWEYCGEFYQTADVANYTLLFANLGCDITKYDTIKLELMNMGTTSSATVNFRYIIDGSTLSTSNYRWAATRNYYDGTTASDNTNGGWDTNYARIGYTHDATVHFTYGELFLPYPSRSNTGDSYSASIERAYHSWTKGMDGNSRPMNWSGCGRHTVSESGDLTGVYLYTSAGNFRNIHVRVLGRLKR
jgi:hypothetical protein